MILFFWHRGEQGLTLPHYTNPRPHNAFVNLLYKIDREVARTADQRIKYLIS